MPVVVEQLSHSAFALTDPGLRLSRTRLFPKATRIVPDVASMGVRSEVMAGKCAVRATVRQETMRSVPPYSRGGRSIIDAAVTVKDLALQWLQASSCRRLLPPITRRNPADEHTVRQRPADCAPEGRQWWRPNSRAPTPRSGTPPDSSRMWDAALAPAFLNGVEDNEAAILQDVHLAGGELHLDAVAPGAAGPGVEFDRVPRRFDGPRPQACPVGLRRRSSPERRDAQWHGSAGLGP